MAARMKDIAMDLGVSLMTVSKALRNHSDISEETRQRVLRRARELNYEPNWIARSLATRRTFMVGVVIPDLMHSFFAEVAKGIARHLDPLGYQVVISNTDENPAAERRQVDLLVARHIDGLIIATALPSWKQGGHAAFESAMTPYVLIDRLPAGLDANYVGVRDEELGEMATAHLVAQGCRRVAHLRGPATANSAGRLRGYKRALAKAGAEFRPEYVVQAGGGDMSGFTAMRHLLSLPDPPDGAFCYNDPVAAGAIQAVLEHGLRVPGDVAIIGAGNVHYSDQLRVPLSTIDQGSGQLGEAAAELLVRCIESKTPVKPSHVLIPPRLVVRESSRRQPTDALRT
ncbi:LacI family DNA-binding transcriptional regulator [uncultured Paludibaculum sp.]|uniref:LacI family DNA-binding transcriptional regulator n=1 Tax=uncultured Paludibaculum sp. TaxID=1765020 RepID=UPI002AABDEB5|nr:LacI family DNA-binding transcriptional regulator [uncultured Paludibaculum sp.]